MKIGFTCQGSSDEAFINGLKERLCPNSKLERGVARGTSKISFRREIPNILLALRSNGCDVFIILNDSDGKDFRKVKREETSHVPGEYADDVVYGVANRNIECWLTIDPDYCLERFGTSPPKGLTERNDYFITSIGRARDFKKDEIAAFVSEAPIKTWCDNDKSFEQFYVDLKSMAKRKNCRKFRDERYS